MTIEDYLLNTGSEDRRVYQSVRFGRIDKLLEICPDAETLVAKVKNCRKFGYDIMANLAMNDNIEMFDKILKTYFSERSEQNDRLRCEFLLSHQIGSRPKDFHYFSRYASQETQEQISKITGRPVGHYTPNPKKIELYKRIRDAWREAAPLSDPHEKMDDTRLGIAPKGVAATEFRGYIGNPEKGTALTYESYTETYPRIRLVNIPETQSDDPLRCPVMELTDIRYTPGRNDLAEQAFDKMHFPDLWGNGDSRFFEYLHNFGATYCDIRENDPVAAASFKNFNQSGKFFTFENRKDTTHKGNLKEGIDYGGYSSSDYICLRTDYKYDEETVLHELAHDTDKRSNFRDTDLYRFAATAMAAHPETSAARKMAVEDTRSYYPASQYETESLARVAQSYLSRRHQDDPLLAATYDIFSAYGQAQLDDNAAIVNRIKHCMRLRIPGNVGYENFEKANKAKTQYFINQDHHQGIPDGILYSSLDTPPACSEEEVRHSEQEFQNAYNKLTGGRYQFASGRVVSSYQFVENALIKCINDEMKAIEKIKACPEAGKVILELETLQRDNITEDMPLEVMAARNFAQADKIFSPMAKMRPLDKLERQLQIFTEHSETCFEMLKEDSKEGRPLDRELFCDGTRETAKALIFANAVAQHYFPHYEPPALDINDCLPQISVLGATGTSKTLKRIGCLQENIELINNPDPELRCPAEIISNPYISMKANIASGEKQYQDLQKKLENACDAEERQEAFDEFFQKIKNRALNSAVGGQIANLRAMQLLYKELHPEAKTLPRDLQFSSLTPASLEKPSADKPSPATETVRKYVKLCRDRLENKTNMHTAGNQR